MEINEVLKFCGIGIYAVFAVMIIRELKREVSQNISFGIIAVMLCISVPLVSEFVGFISTLGNEVSSEVEEYISVVLKALGITYITYISVEICRTAGENGIAGQLEFVGRMEILLLCIPYFKELISIALL